MANTITSNSPVNASEPLLAEDSPTIDHSITNAPRVTSSALAALSGTESVQGSDIDRAANDILSDPTQLRAMLSTALDSL